MIYREINQTRTKFTFTFTGRHIYCFIHALSLTSNALKIINQILVNYDNANKEELEQYKTLLCDHKNYNTIMFSIENMMTGKPVIYMEQIEEGKTFGTEKLVWFNNLFLDQQSCNIMPPITITEPKID